MNDENDENDPDLKEWIEHQRWSICDTHPASNPEGWYDYVKLVMAVSVMFAVLPLTAIVVGREIWFARKIMRRKGWIRWWTSLIVGMAAWLGVAFWAMEVIRG